MNKTKRLFSCLALLGLLTTSQAQTPDGSIMVIPNKFLLIQAGYSSEINGNQVLDYQKARMTSIMKSKEQDQKLKQFSKIEVLK